MRAILATLLSGVLLASGAVMAETSHAAETTDESIPVMLVLDTSGSMNASAGSGATTTKIEDARRAVIDLVEVLAPAQRVGLLAYPGNSETSEVSRCQVGEVLMPLGPPDKLDTQLKVRNLQADGGTPTSPALIHAAEVLEKTKSSHAVIVLVSDGQANCGEPVCETAKELRDRGIELTINTVGFDTVEDSDLSDTLQCVAQATGGRYANARNAEELRKALRELAAANVEVSAEVPSKVPVVVGRSASSGTRVAVTVENTGTIEAKDVRVSLDFTDSQKRGGALLVTRPVKFVGNLPAGARRELEFDVRPDDSRVNEVFTWFATATTSGGGGDLDEGETRTVSQASLPKGAFLEVDGPVAIVGDSYSSGEGAGAYLVNTAKEESTGRCSVDPPLTISLPSATATPTTAPCRIKTGNACHRSMKTYGGLLFVREKVRIIACSGAVTSDFYGAQMSGGLSVPPQLRELRSMALSNSSPEAVLMTIGGNDAGFADLIGACASSSDCWGLFRTSPKSQVYVDRVGTIVNDLLDVYRDVNSAVNDTKARAKRHGKVAPIVVLPYVRIIPNTGAGPKGCFTGISEAEIAFLNSFIDLLNGTIATAVLKVQKEGLPIYYATDVIDAMQPDHTICDGGQSYAVTQQFDYGVGVAKGLFAKDQQWLHPNADGYRAIADAVAGWSRTAARVTGTDAAEWPSSGRVRVMEHVWPTLSPHTSIAGLESPGAEVSASSGGFAPGSQVVLRSRSTPRLLGSAFADSNGRASVSGRLADDIPTGSHQLILSGIDPQGQPRDVTSSIRVVPRHTALAALLVVFGLAGTTIGAIRRRRVKEVPGRARNRRG